MTAKSVLSYSGDTFIRIRDGKHDKSSAFTHAYDMQQIFESNLVERKPILLLSTDGASDEAPRYPKPLAYAVYFFKELGLDALLHGVNVAGLSAFNAVERRMSPLSHDVAGVVVPHDSFGSHLDAQGKTIDENLEKENFSRLPRFWLISGQTPSLMGILWTARRFHLIRNSCLPMNWQIGLPVMYDKRATRFKL